jgi:hypothetical protein
MCEDSEVTSILKLARMRARSSDELRYVETGSERFIKATGPFHTSFSGNFNTSTPETMLKKWFG